VKGETFLDPLQFLRALDETEVPCLLIGRQALVLLGAPLLSQDYDIRRIHSIQMPGLHK